MKRILAIVCAALLYGGPCGAAENSTTGVDYIKGPGLNVANLESSTKFYTDVLGLKVAVVVPKGPIKDAREVILTVTGEFDMKGMTALSLTHTSNDPLPEGRTAYGRMIVFTSNAEAIAARAQAAGFAVTRSKSGSAIFVSDPDGYRTEVYQPPK